MPDAVIVTDSVACLPAQLVQQYAIEIIPFNLMANGKYYHDGVDITAEQAYAILLQDPDSFKTSPYTPDECLEVFRKVGKRAARIICVTVSAKISTAFNVASLIRERAKLEIPGVKIDLLDSETAASGEGFVVLAAARAIEAGKSAAEALEAARQVKQKVHSLVLLESMQHVYRSGRVPRIAAQAASVLNIRPIFTLYGAVHFETAVRNSKTGIERMLYLMNEKVDKKPIHCAVMHAFDLRRAEDLKQQVARDFNCIELWISEFSPIMGYATGTGTLGLAFYTES